MNIDELYTVDAHEEGYEVNIINPANNKPTDIFIRIMGPDSRAWRRAQKADLAKLIAKRANKDADDKVEDELINEDIEKMVSVTIGWRGLERDSKELAFSKDECRNLYTKSPIVMDQMQNAVYNYQNFTKG